MTRRTASPTRFEQATSMRAALLCVAVSAYVLPSRISPAARG